MIDGYSKEDIIKLLQRISKETEENRDKAFKLYDVMENAMLHNKGDLIVLSQMADKYLDQATKQTELLVRLSQVMQKLNQVELEKNPAQGQRLMGDINQILELMDVSDISPFVRKVKGKAVVVPPTEVKQLPEKPSQSDVELSTDL